MTTRRTLLKGGAAAGGVAGLGLLAWQIGGQSEWLTPRAAKLRGVPLQTLSQTEAETLEALGEVLLPGAREAGIALFVDKHLSVPPSETLLTLRYLDVSPPYALFYKAALAALDAFAGGSFARLAPQKAVDIVKAIANTVPEGWKGPPSPMFYFAVRSDEVDVVYGTEEGFEKLGVLYMPHIRPPSKW